MSEVHIEVSRQGRRITCVWKRDGACGLDGCCCWDDGSALQGAAMTWSCRRRPGQAQQGVGRGAVEGVPHPHWQHPWGLLRRLQSQRAAPHPCQFHRP